MILLSCTALKFNHPYFSNLTKVYPKKSEDQKNSHQSPREIINEN